jgi:putative FmdB family regulatory protein
MPLYGFKCSVCGHKFDEARRVAERDNMSYCPECFNQADRMFNFNTAIRVFKPFWCKDLDPSGPIMIETKKQLAEECKKRDCTSMYVADSYNTRY